MNRQTSMDRSLRGRRQDAPAQFKTGPNSSTYRVSANKQLIQQYTQAATHDKSQCQSGPNTNIFKSWALTVILSAQPARNLPPACVCAKPTRATLLCMPSATLYQRYLRSTSLQNSILPCKDGATSHLYMSADRAS